MTKCGHSFSAILVRFVSGVRQGCRDATARPTEMILRNAAFGDYYIIALS